MFVVCIMIFIRIVTFKNYCQYEMGICGCFGDGVKFVRFVCVFFKVVKMLKGYK